MTVMRGGFLRVVVPLTKARGHPQVQVQVQLPVSRYLALKAMASTSSAAAGSNNSNSNNNSNNSNLALFAGGCFWGVELAFQRLHGVTKTTVGYANGHVQNPSYKQVCTGETGHAEAIRIEFDPLVISYKKLLDVFWSIHDPTSLNQQKGDIGPQYRSGVYYFTEEQRQEAEKSKQQEQTKHDKPIVTEIVQAGEFWPAEEYHQQYLEKGGQRADKGCTEPIMCYGL